MLSSGQWLRWAVIGGIFLLGLALALAWWAVRPAPPTSLVLSAGAAGGAYLEFAQRYAAILARDGVRVEVRTSAGSLQNVQRLRLPSADPQAADVAFIQSGTTPADQRTGLVALGHLYYEPAWLFVRRPLGDMSVVDFAGKRINVGAEGSGTRALALGVLQAARIDPASMTLLDLEPMAAVDALRAGQIDGMLLVAKADAPLVRSLLQSKEVVAVSWPRAEALQRLLPEVRKITVPAGVVDFKGNVPERDLNTIAALATLVARDDLHPALSFLLVRAAREIHGGPGLLNAAHEFPSIRALAEFDVPDEVRRQYESGPPLLYRYLPYWLANLLMRLWVLVIPLLAVAAVASNWLPRLLTMGPALRVQRLYWRVKAVEARAAGAEAQASPQAVRREIDALRGQVDTMRVPATMFGAHYDLRRQLRLLREDLDAAGALLPDSAPAKINAFDD